MTRKRWLGLLIAALIVPLPAFALTGGSASASLDVAVSNAGCGVTGGTSVVCQLQVSFNSIDGAQRYTASVTTPDGSVIDVGAIGPGGATVPVPYVGDGTYSVSVSAWGKPPSNGHPKPLATDSVGHVRNTTATVGDSAGTRGANVGRKAHGDVSHSAGARGANTGNSATATVEPSTPASSQGQQSCTMVPTPPPSTPPATPAPAPAPGDGGGSTTTTTTQPQQPAPPPTPTCPDGSPVPAGGCCPNP